MEQKGIRWEQRFADYKRALSRWHKKARAMSQTDTWSSCEAIGRFLDIMKKDIPKTKARTAIAA